VLVTNSQKNGRFITFYSYKGGTGRSMALANVAWILASNGYDILLIDWDLEAPGLHRYMKPFLIDYDLVDTPGLIDYLWDVAEVCMTPPTEGADAAGHEFPLMQDYSIGLKWNFGEKGSISLIPAGQQNKSYAQRVNTFNWDNFYTRLGGGKILEAERERLREKFDYVLIDSRTGVSDTSSICTVHLPDVLVVLFTLNRQSIDGAAAVALSIDDEYRSLHERSLPIFPVYTRVENAETEKRDAAIKYARNKFKQLLLHVQQDKSEVSLSEQSTYWTKVETNYVTFYAFEEVLAVFKDEPGRGGTMLAANEGIARWITEDVVRSLNPIDEERRSQIVNAYAFETTRGIQIRRKRKPKVERSTPILGTFGTQRADAEMARLFLGMALNPPIPDPPYRSLRIYAYDPGQQTDPTMFDVSVATVTVPWERNLKSGPVGEYLEVVDVDPATDSWYAPVDLNHPNVLATSGLVPSLSSPQFHQQMAYAVAMRTIERFERALGRKALWARRRPSKEGEVVPDLGYVRKLRIYPHALREANAYYDPEKLALLFGYFQAVDSNGTVVRGSRLFTVVSHDIIAHETTHALLDGLHPRYCEPTNVDMAAFPEAFADIVALFQHFSMPESLTRQIRQAKGSTTDIGRVLGQLAQQFGRATGMYGALRREIGASPPVLTDDMTEPHTRGAILVSAVFAAFLTIYQPRCANLILLATSGSGNLPGGEISVDLANRLASDASKTAEHVLNMCIRALDYCPPVNLEFGDYLRAIVTADRDLVHDDSRGYRGAFIDAFRERGIVPYGLDLLDEDSLLWEPPPMDAELASRFTEVFPVLDLSWGLTIDRVKTFELSQKNAGILQKWLTDPVDPTRQYIRQVLGFEEPAKQWTGMIGERSYSGEIRPIEVHSVRDCRRSGPDGLSKSTLVIELTQTFRADPDQTRYRGGCTLLFDRRSSRLCRPQAAAFAVVVREPGEGATGGGGRRCGRLADLLCT
jgi:MinD-like ATPase involved in chromosome partitioning or flagellar assembly